MRRSSSSTWPLLAIAGAVLLAGGGTAVAYQLARGLRNNNPGNIRRSSTVWKGQRPEQTDAAFVQFTAPEYGIRALARTLTTYQNSYGLATIRELIGRWAPPSENDTGAYVAAVARALDVSPDEPLRPIAPHLPKLAAAIIRHENGIQPYPLELIARGVSLA